MSRAWQKGLTGTSKGSSTTCRRVYVGDMESTAVTESAQWRGHVRLGDILAAAGVADANDLLVIRHTFTEDALPSIEAATPARVLAHTRRQSALPGKFPASPPRLWLTFLADGQRRSRFVAAYENLGEAVDERTETLRFYHLRPSELLSSLAGRLVVHWSKDTINWAKRGPAALGFGVTEIADRDAVPFPGFDSVRLTFAQLREVMTDSRFGSWRTALGAVQGIYVIADRATGKLYVGKADGGDRILGRWRTYSETGHGGNKALIELLLDDPQRAQDLEWSILRVFGSSTTPDVIDASEAHFKATLLSREFGYNEN